jgi:pyrroline-5-carboxylate reductase
MLASPFVAAPPPRYGFVGVGTMSSAIVRGMCTLSTLPMTSIVLSPRGADKVATLKALFPDMVTIAADNQAVLDACDIVFVGVLPKH